MSLSLSSRFDGSACVACDVLGAMCSVCAPVDAARVRAAREMSVPVVGSPVFGDAATDALVARLGCSAPVPSYALPADVVSALREAEGRLSGDEQFYALRCSEACDALEFLNENSVADGFVLEWVDGDLVVSRVGMREWEAEEAYDDMLNECYPVVSLGGYDYDHARAFKSVDPIAYRCGMLDWLDSEGIELL
jgi:hypothetical protein